MRRSLVIYTVVALFTAISFCYANVDNATQQRNEDSKDKTLPGSIETVKFSKLSWIDITYFLALSGAAGGLAWHLAKNHGHVRLPYLTTHPKPQRGENKYWNTIECGIVGDILTGGIAANSIHMAIAGIVDYQAPIDEQRIHRFQLNLIALGILTGFAGSPILKSLSKKLLGSLTREEVEQITENKINSQAALSDALSKAGIAMASSNTVLPSDRQTAIDLLWEQLELHPSVRQIGIYIGALNRRLKKYDEAIRAVTKVMEVRRANGVPINRDDADLIYNRACYHVLSGENDPTKRALALADIKASAAIHKDNIGDALEDDDLKPIREEIKKIQQGM